MIPIRTDRKLRFLPVVTITLIALNVIVYIWDRQGSLLGSSVTFADLAMRPHMVVDVLGGESSTRLPLVTLLTSMFLHGNLVHLIGNMVFLGVFGRAVEDAIGAVRFTLYYLAWGLVAGLAQVYVMPNSMVPIIGASGAIGGVLGAYFLLFPASKIDLLVPFLFTSFVVSAWVLLGIWFLWQVLIPQQGVANWAHAGGFLAGMLTVLVMGGRKAIIAEEPSAVTVV